MKQTKTYAVTSFSEFEGREQVHMTAENGDTLRFYAADKEWTFKAFFTGKITKKQLEKIIDVWYMFDNQCRVNIGDKVTV